jgi:hypothetical protein
MSKQRSSSTTNTKKEDAGLTFQQDWKSNISVYKFKTIMLLFDKRLPSFAKNITLNVIIKNPQINTMSLQKM